MKTYPIQNDYNLAFAIVAQQKPIDTTPATFIEREATILAEKNGTLDLIDLAQMGSKVKGGQFAPSSDWLSKVGAEYLQEAESVWELTTFYPICLDGFAPTLIQYKHDDCDVKYYSLPSSDKASIKAKIAEIVPAWAFPFFQFYDA